MKLKSLCPNAFHTSINKYLNIFIFIIYSWLIYNSFIFIGGPILLYSFGVPMYGEIVLTTLGIFFFILAESPNFHHIINMCVLALFLLIFYLLPIIWWWKKQTILTALLLSMLGLVIGPGSFIFWSFLFKNQPLCGPFILVSLVLFYLFLYYGNKLQKRYFPENKIANELRKILQWPCLRT